MNGKEWQAAGGGRRLGSVVGFTEMTSKAGSGAAPEIQGKPASGASGVKRSYVGNHNTPRMLLHSFRDRILTVSASW